MSRMICTESSAMLMFTGQKPEQLLTSSMPETENKHHQYVQSPADLYKEFLAP